jgi:hypothetical protein
MNIKAGKWSCVWRQLYLDTIQELWLEEYTTHSLEGIFHDVTGVGNQGVSTDDQHILAYNGESFSKTNSRN